MCKQRIAMALIAFLLAPAVSEAWSPCIHGVMSLQAFEELTSDDQADILNLLKYHPQYDELIAAPAGSSEEESRMIVISNAGMWADRISGTKHDRPKWHFYDGVVSTVGDVQGILPAAPPTELPPGDLESPRELNLIQAFQLCQRTVKDKELSDAERAVALCWLLNLVGDLHQPMHLGSLYAKPTFADRNGDDHGREILFGDVSLFEAVENYVDCQDTIEDVRALKARFDQRDILKRSFDNAAKYSKDDWYLKSLIGMSRGESVPYYYALEKQIEEACAAGETSPLKLKGGSDQVDLRHGDLVVARGAGCLSTVLGDCFFSF